MPEQPPIPTRFLESGIIRLNEQLCCSSSNNNISANSTANSTFIEYFCSNGVQKRDAKLIVCHPCSVCCCSTAPNSSLLASHFVLSGNLRLTCFISVIFFNAFVMFWNASSWEFSHFHSTSYFSRVLSGAHSSAKLGMNLFI